MKTLRGVLICAAALLCFVSCTQSLPPLISFAHFSPPVKQSFTPTTNTSIVYGRFATGPDFAFGNELALRVRNDETKREYLIHCRDKDSVSAIMVEPGQYRVVGFVATFVDRRTAGRRTFTNTPSFQVPSNSATYLGDFSGYAKVGGLTQTWGIAGLTNNSVATTREFRQKYPNLAPLSTVSVFER